MKMKGKTEFAETVRRLAWITDGKRLRRRNAVCVLGSLYTSCGPQELHNAYNKTKLVGRKEENEEYLF